MSLIKAHLESEADKPTEKAINKTLYIKAEDVAVWEKGRELADDKLTSLLTTYLKSFVAEKEAEALGNHKIILRYKDNGKLPVSKSFYGRWIFTPESPMEHELDTYAIAVTAKNNLVFFDFIGSDEQGFLSWGKMYIFSTFDEAIKSKAIPEPIVVAAMAKKGIEIQELDI
ncbi:MAG: hypothetical protein EBR02_09385 [Alphaproteobacteria bacterium]|nr:hypothetical protein [Alphaproteobacteria bacterium]